MSRQHDTSEVGGAPDRSKDRNSSPGSMVNVAYGMDRQESKAGAKEAKCGGNVW